MSKDSGPVAVTLSKIGGRQANCLLGDGWKYFNLIISDTIIVGRHRAAIGLAGVIAPLFFCDNTLENFLESLLLLWSNAILNSILLRSNRFSWLGVETLFVHFLFWCFS